jgi:hypothetical protein
MILDILYEIISDGKEIENQIDVLRRVISIYNQTKKGEQDVTKIQKTEKND